MLGSSTENIAVEALGHILSTSEAALSAIVEVLKTGGANFGTESLDVRTQASDEEGARPDLAGSDEHGTERLLIEAKFWAGLTKRQPVTYLERLQTGQPSALLFVAPAARFEPLWAELRRRVVDKGMDFWPESRDANLWTAEVGGERRLMLISWRALLERMESKASMDGESYVVADIRQLLGLTQRMDEDAFLPLRPEELGPEFPRRMRNLRRLVDDATTRAREAKWVSTQGLIVTSKPKGYGRYMRLAGATVWFGVNFILWSRTRDTPLWLTFHEGNRRMTLGEVRSNLQPLRQKYPPDLIDSGGRMHVPIDLPVSVEYDAVLDAVVERLKEVARLIDSPDPTN